MRRRALACLAFAEALKRLHKPVFRWYYGLENWQRRIRIRAGNERDINERPFEYGFTMSHLPYGRDIRILDVGTGVTPFGAMLATCNYRIDCLENTKYRRGFLPLNSHCNLISGDITDCSIPDGVYDAVTCISTLEHIEDCDGAVRNMGRVLKPGGLLILTFPFNRHMFMEDSYKHEDSNRFHKNVAYICRIYSDAEIKRWCELTGATVDKQIFAHYYAGKFWNSGERLPNYKLVGPDDYHDTTCVVLRKQKA
ncbi:MAG: class I SAM-dependent methyltransferase [Planctomycetes bacterium]|nr:class I SAM-dependent methyltransferase [Planctomycetota bacterium]